MGNSGKYKRDPHKDIQKMHMQRILDFIREYREATKISPNLSEISEHIYGHNKGFGNISPMINKLIKEGFLKRIATGSRTLMLADPQPREFYYRREDSEGNEDERA